MESYCNAFGSYMRRSFGEIVYKVNVDAGFTCPNRDGTIGYGGCIYCNNDSFRPSACTPALGIKAQVQRGITYLTRRYKSKKFIVYFQPYTNTYADVAELEKLYREALDHPAVVGLAIGTRPDCVDEDKISLLEDLAKDYFVLVEYGIQSIYDKSLVFINRGHDYNCFLNTLNLTKGRGIHIGAHIIAGFPTETIEEMQCMAYELSALPIDFLKIHQLQVVKNTRLAVMYENSPFHVFGYEEYLDFIAEFVERLSPRIVVQRMFALSPDDILIAPRWSKTRQEIIRDIDNLFKSRHVVQGEKAQATIMSSSE
ncbi:MAG: TIGR01212 family radical SAM protein [Nitrospirae bacterium]|nr:TIGR01212 family radical SAM protein [Nitrospirota bacterium]